MIPEEIRKGLLSIDEKNRIFMTLDAQTETLESLKRGMYGDLKNKQRGLVDDVQDIKAWIERSKRKIAYIAGIGTAIGFVFSKAWEYFMGKHNP